MGERDSDHHLLQQAQSVSVLTLGGGAHVLPQNSGTKHTRLDSIQLNLQT